MKLFKQHPVRMTITLVLLIVAGISIGVIIQDFWQEDQSRQKQEQLQQLWSSSSTITEPQAQGGSESSVAYANPQFEELLTINPDLVGWLEVGEFSAPVVQGSDNDYYLTHDFYGNQDPHGTVFVDKRNNVESGDDNLVLYGHNYNKSKQVFYEVEKYKQPAYAMQHPVFSFTTLHQKRDYLVLGVFIANTEPAQGDVFDYHNQLHFSTTQEMNDFIAQVRARSLISTDVPADNYDQLITLSTCGYDFSGERIVLVGRRLRPTETPETLAGTVYTANPTPLMPDIWQKLYGST